MSKGYQHFSNDLPERFGVILRKGPSGRRHQFLGRGVQTPEVGEMSTALVRCRVELEMDLVMAADEADPKHAAEIPLDEPVGDAFREAETKEVLIRRPIIQPARRQAKFRPNRLGILHQPRWKWARAAEVPVLERGQDIHVTGHPIQQPQCDQCRAPADHQMDGRTLAGLHQVTQERQRAIQRWRIQSTHEDRINTEIQCFKCFMRDQR